MGDHIPVLCSVVIFYRQCMAVFDEKCVTKYPAKCVKEQQCTMLYQTVCDVVGYAQKCRKMPKQQCNPVTKCHRTPKTKCKPTKDKECGNVNINIPIKQERHRCLPFEPRETPDLSACQSSGASTGLSSGYRVPQAAPLGQTPTYGAPQVAPLGQTPTYGAPSPDLKIPTPNYSNVNSAPSVAPPPPMVLSNPAPVNNLVLTPPQETPQNTYVIIAAPQDALGPLQAINTPQAHTNAQSAPNKYVSPQAIQAVQQPQVTMIKVQTNPFIR